MEANLIPDLVRALRELRPPRYRTEDSLKADCVPLIHPLACLEQLFEDDLDNDHGLRKTAVQAGLVPGLMDLLTLSHEPTTDKIIELAGSLLKYYPEGEARPWVTVLMRAIVQQILAHPPAALNDAAVTLYNVGVTHPELIKKCYACGMKDTDGKPWVALCTDTVSATSLKDQLSAPHPED
jgi:hypothetical protein